MQRGNKMQLLNSYGGYFITSQAHYQSSRTVCESAVYLLNSQQDAGTSWSSATRKSVDCASVSVLYQQQPVTFVFNQLSYLYFRAPVSGVLYIAFVSCRHIRCTVVLHSAFLYHKYI